MNLRSNVRSVLEPDVLTPHVGEPPIEDASTPAAERLGAAEAALALDEELNGMGLRPRLSEGGTAAGGHRPSRFAAAQAAAAVTIMPGAYPGAAIFKVHVILANVHRNRAWSAICAKHLCAVPELEPCNVCHMPAHASPCVLSSRCAGVESRPPSVRHLLTRTGSDCV